MLDLAWAAGLYEGEGTLAYAQRSIRIQVSQKDRWILDRLRDCFGGSVRVEPERVSRTGQTLVMHKWYLHGTRARGFLLTIFTWLSPRRRQRIVEVFCAA